jgi:predicted nuclease of predicted toxin-antitoxin system
MGNVSTRKLIAQLKNKANDMSLFVSDSDFFSLSLNKSTPQIVLLIQCKQYRKKNAVFVMRKEDFFISKYRGCYLTIILTKMP